MANPNQNKEAPKREVTVEKSVQSLIDRKKAEKAEDAKLQVSEGLSGTKEGVAEVMAGVEKPSEKISERKGESGEKGDISAGGSSGGDDDAVQIRAGIQDYDFPRQEVMVKKIRTAINAQIKFEMKKAIKLQKNLNSGSAADYNKSIARIRELKKMLSGLFSATKDFLRTAYVKYFRPDGSRKEVEKL